MEEGFQATEVCSALFSLLLGQGGGVDVPAAPKPANLPTELEPHEGFAKPKGFKKQPFQGNGPSQGPRPGFKPGFKPNFEKGKPGKFAKGFKKDRGPRY